jgi:hypothetical protein
LGGQSCGKVQYLEDLGYIAQSMIYYLNSYGKILQGNAGEEAANEYAVKEMNLRQEKFDKNLHGFDCVFRDGSGKLVIGEAKATKASGVSSLAPTNHGKEGSVEWVEYKAQLMCDPLSSFYSEANRKIGEEILSRGAKHVEFVVIHIHPETLNVDVTNLR